MKGDRMRREGDRLRKRVAISIMKTSDTRSQNLGGDKSSNTTSHVNHSGSGEIMHSTAQEGVGVEGGDPSRGRPDGVNDNGVDETREHKTVGKVGLELAAFSDSTGNY